MSYTVTLQQRIQQLKKAQADLPNILADVAKGATMRAVEAAQDATPPKSRHGPPAGHAHHHRRAESPLGDRQSNRTRRARKPR